MYVQRLQTVIASELLLAVVYGQVIVKMMHYKNLDGQSCTQQIFETIARSDISCVTKCVMEPTCLSSFYTPDTRRCIGCGSVYNDSDLSPLTNESDSLYYRPGAKYNQSCSNTKSCVDNNTVCFPGLDACVCDPAFVYDPSSASCKDECTTYGLTYQRYPNHILWSHDRTWRAALLGLSDCLFTCSHNKVYQCFSVDYDPTKSKCWYNVKRMVDVPADWKYLDYYDIYVRNCA